jgi:hypothetical protein
MLGRFIIIFLGISDGHYPAGATCIFLGRMTLQ